MFVGIQADELDSARDNGRERKGKGSAKKQSCPPEAVAGEGNGSPHKDFSGNSGLDCSLQLNNRSF